MRIEFLKLYNFRNYEKMQISFHPHLNLIYGKNGSGKTNLVEAIYVLALTRSFRLVNDKTLIMDGALACKIEGKIVNKYTNTYQIVLNKAGKKVAIDNDKKGKLSDYIAKITIILFHPDDLRFIKDTPSTRRKNLNISISMLDLVYLRYLSNYNKILKQRNAYLKQLMVNSTLSNDYLDILTEKLVYHGLEIHQKRKKFIGEINEFLGDFYEKITGYKNLQVMYLSSYNELSKEEILNAYQSMFTKDVTLGKTNFGIHTDDLKFTLNGKDLKEYGSEGQQKNAIIAYKFSELEVFKKYKNFYPIFILDDLFSELDKEKVKNIMNLLKDDIQTFITTTELDKLPFLNDFSYKQFYINEGKVVEESEHERGK